MSSIIFIDNSGSVNNNELYWNEVNKILELNNIKEYYLWNSDITKTTKDDISKSIINKIGLNGTIISNVAKQIIDNNYYDENIIIITDGEVNMKEVNLSETLLENKKINLIECYIISEQNEENLNVSVPLAFMRNGNSKLYISNTNDTLKLIKNINIEDFELLNDITVENLLDNYDKIYDLLNIKNMGKNGLPEIKEKLIKIRNEYIKISNKKLNKNDGVMVKEHLLNENYEEALKLLNKIENDFKNNEDNSYYSKFNKLLSLCDDRSLLGYALYQKVNNAKKTEDINPDEDINLDNYKFEDPILFDIDVPQLILLDDEVPLLNDKLLKQLIENPLSILNNEEIKNKISKRIGHCLGVKISNKLEYDPYTRKRIIGTIPLTIDNKQHLKVGSNSLYKLFTNGKIIGNSSLYYIIIWKIINENKCEYLNEQLNYINNHLKYRIQNSTTYISMQGLPEFNRTIVPLEVSMYYIINSCLINMTIFKMHLFNINILVDIITNIFNYKINDDVLKYINIMMVSSSMLKLYNYNKYNFNNKLKCLTNTYSIVNNLYIHNDEEISEEEYNNQNIFPKYYNNLTKNELLYIASFVIKYNTSNIPYTTKLIYNYEFTKSWNYDVLNIKMMDISLKTFRPYYVENWKELAEKEVNIDVKYQMSGYNDYIRCYLKYKKFVSFEEYKYYVYKKYNKPVHINISNIYNEIFMSYIFVKNYIEENKLNYNDVKQILLKSCKIEDRMKIQDNM